MSYLDDLANGSTGASGSNESAASASEIVRTQIEEGKFDAFQVSDTLYKVSDIGFAAGYAEGVITVDEESGTCGFNINTHIPAPSELRKGFDRFCRHVNGSLITRGFTIDDGSVRFVNEIPIDVKNGEDVSVAFARAMSSIHRYTEDFSLILAGIDPWEVVEAGNARSEEDPPQLSMLRSLLGGLD